jgi:hypothetical protein
MADNFDTINTNAAQAAEAAAAEAARAEESLRSWEAERKARAEEKRLARVRQMDRGFIRRVSMCISVIALAVMVWCYELAHGGLVLAVIGATLMVLAFWSGVWWQFRSANVGGEKHERSF